MREPSFWWRSAGFEAAMLSPISLFYGAVAAYRMDRPGRGVGIPVLCIGNLTVGGAGKTPTAIAFARLLINAGRRVFFLSRGYGGQLAGPVRVDPVRHTAADVGDEPLLLARLAPTIVAHDRVAGAEMARAAGATAIVMDDGFQNSSLRKNFSIVVIDGNRGVGNGRVIPAGPMRAPLDSQLRHAQALLVLSPQTERCDAVIAAAQAQGIPVFHGQLEAEADAVSALNGLRVLAFAGIGNPQKFFSTMTESGVAVPVTQAFPDHHRYNRAEADALIERAAREKLVLVTTEKDLVRIARDPEVAALAKVARALPATMQLEDEDSFRQLLMARMA